MDLGPRPKRVPSTSTRAESKCEICRSRKIKCHPEDRDYAAGEICEPCRRSGYPCGPNTVKPRVRHNPRSAHNPHEVEPAQMPPVSIGGADQLGHRTRTVLIQQHRAPSHSSSATPSLIFQPPNSPEEDDHTGPLRRERSTYERCRRRLSKMGYLIDLCRFIRHRHKALIRMKKALPLIGNIIETEAPLQFFLQKTGDHISGYFFQIDRFRKSLEYSSAEWEMISRRMIITGQLFLSLHTDGPDVRNVTEFFRNAHNNLKEELFVYYHSIDDSTEADRIRFQSIEADEYLANCPVPTLVQVAARISTVMKSVLEDLPSVYKDALNLEDPVEITASHLALMASRWNEDIDLNECPPSGGSGLTGRNTYHLAAEVGNAKYLRHHLKHSPDATARFLSARDVFGLTPIMVAAYSGDLEVFQVLHHHGAKLNEQTPTGKTILSLACMAGDSPIVRHILSSGIDIHGAIRWCSPLHDAIEAGRHEVVELLIQSGADPRTKFHDWTAAEWAEKFNYPELANRLTSADNSVNTEESHQASVRAGKKRRYESAAGGEAHSSRQVIGLSDLEVMLTQQDVYDGFDQHSPPSNVYFSWSNHNFDAPPEPTEGADQFY